MRKKGQIIKKKRLRMMKITCKEKIIIEVNCVGHVDPITF